MAVANSTHSTNFSTGFNANNISNNNNNPKGLQVPPNVDYHRGSQVGALASRHQGTKFIKKKRAELAVRQRAVELGGGEIAAEENGEGVEDAEDRERTVLEIGAERDGGRYWGGLAGSTSDGLVIHSGGSIYSQS